MLINVFLRLQRKLIILYYCFDNSKLKKILGFNLKSKSDLYI